MKQTFPGLSEYRPTADEIFHMSMDDIANTWNAKVDPWYFSFPYIKLNEEEYLNEVAEEKGGYWLAKAIANGHYSPVCKYVLVIEEGERIESFSTPEGFFADVCSPEELAESWAQ